MRNITLKLSAIVAAIALSLSLSSGAYAQGVTEAAAANTVPAGFGPFTGMTWGEAVAAGIFATAFASLVVEALDDDYVPPATTTTAPTTTN